MHLVDMSRGDSCLRCPVMEELRPHVARTGYRSRLGENRSQHQKHRDGNLQLHKATFFHPHIYDAWNAGPDSFSADCYTKTPISGYTTFRG